MNRTGFSAMAMTVLALAASACTVHGASKAGGAPVPITLRIGTDDGPGKPAADQINEFARQVKEVSHGQVIIAPVWNADGPDKNSWDQLLARMVVKGDLEMGLIPARAWDTEGVTSLRALQAPFLIQSDEAMKQVVAPDLADPMLSGLDQIGITGLALFPEELREIFSFGKPILSPADLSGVTVRAPRSNATSAFFIAFNARVDDPQAGVFASAAASGKLAAAESEFAGAKRFPRAATATGNLFLFPKINSLVINKATFTALTDGQRTALQNAAAKTREWVGRSLPSTAQDADTFCHSGGSIVMTSAQNLTAFRTAAAPVYREMEKDPQTKAMIGKIKGLTSSSVGAPKVAPCGVAGTHTTPTSTTTTALAAASSATTVQSKFPDGIYRTKMDAATLMKGGVDSSTATLMDGVDTLSFQDGHWRHQFPDSPSDYCTGSYSVHDGRVVVILDGCDEAGLMLFSANWTLTGKALRFTNLSTDTDPQAFADVVWGRWVWEKIG